MASFAKLHSVRQICHQSMSEANPMDRKLPPFICVPKLLLLQDSVLPAKIQLEELDIRVLEKLERGNDGIKVT